MASVSKGPLRRNPFAGPDLTSAAHLKDGAAGIPLSTGGTICLMAYWVFSAAVFNADAPVPNMYIFPEHHAMLDLFLGEVAAAEVPRSPGTVEALVTMGMWLDHNGCIRRQQDTPAGRRRQPFRASTCRTTTS